MLKIVPETDLLRGRLLYHSADKAFDFDVNDSSEYQQRVRSQGTASLVIQTLQIEVAIAGSLALYVWGYHPREHWKDERLSVPVMVAGGIQCESSRPMVVGVGEEVPGSNTWVTTYDRDSGWVRIGESVATPVDVVMFAEGVAAGIKDAALNCL